MELGVFEARNRFSELVEAAERGEETVVLKHGKAVAKLVPITTTENLTATRQNALADLAALRDRTLQEMGRPFTHAELIEARDDGKR